VLDLRVQYNNDASPETARSHPLAIYKAINEYLLAKIGTYLRRLMYDPVYVDLGKDEK